MAYVNQRIDRYLDVNGDGSGSIDANVDGSSSNVLLKITPAAGQVIRIHRMIVTIRDTGVLTAANTYGVVAGPLTNGIQIGLFDSEDAIIHDFTVGNPIKYNASWAEHCFDVDLKDWGNGPKLLIVRWTFTRAGPPITLTATDGLSFGAKIRDNLTGLEEHLFKVQGETYSP